ncbi:MAG: hypothetical protein LBR43_03490 [Spiroplasmataceae bacterium]|jgi:hypothetical protein|nr:hypothetical protein [Spiroplasmataceae bacterium]
MQKKIYYNQSENKASLDKQRWVYSFKNNQYNQPIFDFNEQEWCVISTTSDKQSLKCFAKEKITNSSTWFHQGYVKVNEMINGIAIFDCYQVEKNPATNKWERPKWA